MIQGVICGKGGQGVITLNAMIGNLAANLGLRSISAETHGMAMRGGSVATYIKIGDCVSASVAKGSADFIISLTPDEALRNIDYLKKGGLLILDGKAMAELENDFTVIAMDATKTAAEKFGNAILAGQILLGALIRKTDGLDTEAAMRVLEKAPKININAIRYGAENV